jgi:hypothetical protein
MIVNLTSRMKGMVARPMAVGKYSLPVFVMDTLIFGWLMNIPAALATPLIVNPVIHTTMTIK